MCPIVGLLYYMVIPYCLGIFILIVCPIFLLDEVYSLILQPLPPLHLVSHYLLMRQYHEPAKLCSLINGLLSTIEET